MDYFCCLQIINGVIVEFFIGFKLVEVLQFRFGLDFVADVACFAFYCTIDLAFLSPFVLSLIAFYIPPCEFVDPFH